MHHIGRTSRPLERLFWIAVVLTGFSCASVILHDAVVNWIEHPSGI